MAVPQRPLLNIIAIVIGLSIVATIKEKPLVKFIGNTLRMIACQHRAKTLIKSKV